MGFTSPFARPPVPNIAPEREALAASLDSQRAELLMKLEGLDDEQAGRRLVPSLNTLHGLVRHLTKVEHVWSVIVLAALDDVRTHHRFGELDVRWVMLQMIKEYAQHNGHADILRELVDGTIRG